MKTSLNANIHSMTDLWLVLERRCSVYMHWESQRKYGSYHVRGFTPHLALSETGQPDFGNYYVPYHCLMAYGDDWEGWVSSFTPKFHRCMD
jgi:hypothetical protein